MTQPTCAHRYYPLSRNWALFAIIHCIAREIGLVIATASAGILSILCIACMLDFLLESRGLLIAKYWKRFSQSELYITFKAAQIQRSLTLGYGNHNPHTQFDSKSPKNDLLSCYFIQIIVVKTLHQGFCTICSAWKYRFKGLRPKTPTPYPLVSIRANNHNLLSQRLG